MTLKDIDYILEVAQTQNFNKAAENLYTAQPTLSYHIKAAAEELGFQIFSRSGRGAALTPASPQFCVTLRNVRAEFQYKIYGGSLGRAAHPFFHLLSAADH